MMYWNKKPTLGNQDLLKYFIQVTDVSELVNIIPKL